MRLFLPIQVLILSLIASGILLPTKMPAPQDAPHAVVSRALFNVKVTSYRSVSNQTDDSPFITSIGHRTSQEGIAVSPDLLKSRSACYGDVVVIPGVGNRIINDVMAARHRRSFDVWVLTLEDEKRFGVKRLDVQVIKSPNRYCKKGD